MAKSKSRQRGRDVGKMGEGTFHTWCGEADLIENRADDDKGGWDYLVQFKPGGAPAPEVRSLDRLPTAPVCWVQVKATDIAANPPIKLSNWKRMVDAPIPAFILIINFGGKSGPKSAHFVHVDEELVCRVLKRLRELPVEDADRLHKHRMDVSPNPEDLLPNLNGLELRSRMEAVLGKDPSSYYSDKQGWRERAGGATVRFELTFSPDEGSAGALHDNLVDFALGVLAEMPSTLVRLEEIRFGVPVQVGPTDLPKKVTLHASERPHARGTLEFVTENGVERARVPCRVYHPWNMFPFIPKERLRYRIATKDFDLIFKDEGGASVSGIPDLDETRTISEWASSMRSLRLLQGSEALTFIIDVSARARGSIGAAGRTISISPATRTLMDAAIDAATVLAQLGFEGDTYRASGTQLVQAAKYLRHAAQMLSSDRTTIFISGDVDDNAPDSLLAGMPLVAAAPIGETLIVVGLAVHGPVVFEQHPSLPVVPRPGKKRFLIRNPEVDRVFVETAPISQGDHVSLLPHIKRVHAWLDGKKLWVIPFGEVEASEPSPAQQGGHPA